MAKLSLQLFNTYSTAIYSLFYTSPLSSYNKQYLNHENQYTVCEHDWNLKDPVGWMLSGESRSLYGGFIISYCWSFRGHLAIWGVCISTMVRETAVLMVPGLCVYVGSSG